MFPTDDVAGHTARLLAMLLIATVGLSAVTGGVAAQAQIQMNESTDTAGPQQCQASGSPKYQSTGIHLEDTTVERGDPAKISLRQEFQPYYDCPVTVLATIEGSDGVEVKVSSGGTVRQVEGAAQAEFRVDPRTGGTLAESSIEVYYDGPVDGTKQIDIDARAHAYPTGYRDDPSYYTTLTGLTETVTVTEPAPAEESSGSETGQNATTEQNDPVPTPESATQPNATRNTPERSDGSDSSGGGPPFSAPLLFVIALFGLVTIVGVVGAAGSN